MPMEAEELDEMGKNIAAARKREMNCAVCMGKKPEGTIFYMSKIKGGEILARNAKKAGDTAKLAWGTCEVKGKKINLMCAEDPPPNLARSMKIFLKDNGFPLKVVILDLNGTVLESDGDDEDEEEADAAAAPGPEEVEPEGKREATEEEADEETLQLAAEWKELSGRVKDLYEAAIATSPPNSGQLVKIWGAAHDKADAGSYRDAITLATRLEEALNAMPKPEGSDADKLREKFDAALPKLQELHEAALRAEPPNMEALGKAWDAMMLRAGDGDHKSALAAAAKLMPALQAASVVDPQAASWMSMESELSKLYTDAMKNNPPDATKLQAAWGMATEKAEAKDFAGALKIGERLKPLLEAALTPRSETSEVPQNVVAFQKSRVLWSKTRQTMMSEMKKLEDAISGAIAEDPELKDIASDVGILTERLKPIDDVLGDILDDITNEADGARRETLKRDAISKIQEYQAELESDFFKDVDNNNGFTSVSVRKAANDSLASIAKVLAG